MKRWLAVGAITLLLVACGKGERSPSYPSRVTPEIEQAFQEGEGFYVSRQWQKADQLFAQFVQRFPYNPLTDPALFRRGEIRFSRGDFGQAHGFYAQVIGGRYAVDITPRAQYKAALSLYKLDRLSEAAAMLKTMRREHASTVLLARSDSLGMLASEEIGFALFLLDDYARLVPVPDELNGLAEIVSENDALARVQAWMEDPSIALEAIDQLPLAAFKGKRSGGYAFYKRAAALSRAGKLVEAQEVLSAYLSTYPTHPYYDDARLLWGEVGGQVGEAKFRIGVILPLSGKFRVYGESVLHGIECAIGIFEPCRGPQGVVLLVRDSEGDPEKARRAVDELDGEKVQAIIGPLSSSDVEAAAKRAEELGIPMITLAQRDGVAEIGDYIFRNSVSPQSQVMTLVDYVLQRKKLKTFFVLSPDNRAGEEYAKLFVDAVEAGGGKIVGKRSYSSHQMEYALQLRQSADVEGMMKSGKPYEAIFIPDSPQVVGYLAPTIAMMGIDDVILLGTARWDNPQFVQRGGEYVEKSIFVSAFVKNSHRPETKDFIDRYRTTYGIDATLLEALGFDSMRMILGSVGEGVAVRRSSIRERLLQIVDFPGVTGKISLTESGDTMRKLTLLTVSDGIVTEIEDER